MTVGKIYLNKYDIAIISIISILVFGGIGGMLSPIRGISLLFSPYVWVKLKMFKPKGSGFVLCFFAVWYGYSLLSLMWTPSVSEAFKELCYYYCHFSLFLLLIFFANKANSPLLSVALGWCLFLIFSFPIAFNEILNDVHLASSLHDDLSVNVNGTIVSKKYAAVTFGNYNSYVTIIGYSLPFLFSVLLRATRFKHQLLGWLLVLCIVYILLTNASRGGILVFCFIFIVFLFFYKDTYYEHKKIFLCGLTFCLIALLIFKAEDLFMQFLLRIGEGELSDMTEDTSRILLISLSLQLFVESCFVGTGIGSIVTSLQKIAPEFTIPHNLFIELLVQYGVVIFLFFIVYLLKLIKRAKGSTNRIVKFVIYSSIFSLPIVGVINSGYWLAPELWVYMASLFIYSYKYD